MKTPTVDMDILHYSFMFTAEFVVCDSIYKVCLGKDVNILRLSDINSFRFE